MEVVAASPGGAGGAVPPFQRRDVEEWSHLDRLTGMLEHARVETDHWAANTHNSQHKYGKVVDSRDRCAADGSQQQRQRRQLEVFQAHVPGGSLQVIRTQTVATSSSRWSSANAPATTVTASTATPTSAGHDFENLQLALNPLDLSSQKTKASVGRSGSIGGRRPPSRPRSIAGRLGEEDVTARLQRVSRLCQQFHDEAVTQTQRPSILDRQNGDGSVSSGHFNFEDIETEQKLNGRQSNTPSPKNCENANVLEQIDDWKSSTKNRRSLLSSRDDSSSSVNKYNSDIDTDRRLNTALRGNNVDLEALDLILKSISSSTSSNYSDKYSLSDDLKTDEQPERDISEDIKESKSSLTKRHSFITVESLQAVRGRLRRLSSPVDQFYNDVDEPKDEEPDDGIVAEDTSMLKKEESSTMPASNVGVSRVRSYVYGMEAMLHNKKPIIGTGSLESRTSGKLNGNSVNRSEDWYNRRKSYGFEQVHNQQIDQSNSISFRGKNKIESSTDSGICRSTEIVVIPSVFKPQQHSSQFNKPVDTMKSDTNSEEANKFNGHKVSTSYSKIGNSTVINLGGDTNKKTSASNCVSVNNELDRSYAKKDNELFSVWNRRAMLNSEDNHVDNNKLIKKDTEQITITIPIVSDDSVSNSNNRRMFHRQMSDGTSMSIESSWSNHNQNNENHDIKRHSIAVDEMKYVNNRNIDNKYPFPQLRRTTVAVTDSTRNDETSNNLISDGLDDDLNANFGKKQKKVEFCKTEVHFAAESGRVNIVETDEKPPPTQNFRRRRRNSSVTNNHVPEDFNKNGLPLIHFGDTSYEKKLFGVSDSENAPSQNDNPETYNKDVKPFNNLGQPENLACNNVTVSSVSVNNDFEPETKEIFEYDNHPRGILKNKLMKPRPYLLGDDNNEILSREPSNEEQEGSIWGVRLRPVHKQEEPTPIWRSTVTVQNTSYNVPVTRETVSESEQHVSESKQYATENSQPEFQKLLHSLRPSRKSEPSIISPEHTVERKATPIADMRRSSWSVADRVKQVEDLRSTEIKGYSTRVNFGGGEATVIENGDMEKHTTWPRQEETHIKDFPSVKSSIPSNNQKKQPDQLMASRYDKKRSAEAKVTSVSLRNNSIQRKTSNASMTESPQVERKQFGHVKRTFELERTPFSNGNLSSPSLVGCSYQKSPVNYQSKTTEPVIQQSKSNEKSIFAEKDERTNTFNKISSVQTKESPSSRRKNIARKSHISQYNSQSTYTKRNDILPKKLEPSISYYNEIQSPKPTKKLADKQRDLKQWKENKPDLLQHFSDTREYVNLSTVIKEDNKNSVTSASNNKSKIADIKKVSSTKKSIRPDSPSVERPESPIYENIDEVISGLNAMEKESAMLQELTKAADQILQAVNGYTDEDSNKVSTDSDEEGKKHRINFKKTSEMLSTISETKSWKQVQNTRDISRNTTNTRSRVKPTSSTSSIDSVTKESQKPVPPVRMNRATKLNEDKTKKKISGSNTEISKATKARRLQRASSREALLQSHGSSSEDITNSLEIIRKPRLVRRSKTQQSSTTTTEEITTSSKKSTISNVTRKKEYDIRRSVDRVPVVGLQEIRHKTAVSTIKSTAEKAASREKAIKARGEDLRKKPSTKKDITSSKGSHLLSSSQHGTSGVGTSGSRLSTAGASRSHGAGGVSTLNAVRTSSGVTMKKHSRSEGITKY